MKFIVCILAVCGLALIAASEYNAFGITKSAAVLSGELAESINKIIGSIGYIQFYDVSEHIKIFPVSPEVTLSSIEMSNLKIATPVTAAQLAYTATDAAATIKGTGLTFGMTADLSLKWTYKVGGAVIYRGTYTAKLKTEKPEIEFSFTHNSDKSTGKIGFGWLLVDPSIKGFGAYGVVLDSINKIIQSKLYPVFGEELNRYNDIIVSAMVYSYYYRSIPLVMPKDFTDKLSIKNVLKKFLVHQTHLSFAFTSSLYYAIQHVEVPFNGTFEPTDDFSKNITLYFGAKQIDELFELVRKAFSTKSFVIPPEKQQELFGYEVTVGSLAAFHSKLAEEYNPDEHMDFMCDILDLPAAYAKKFTLKCKFVLHKDPATVVLDIEKLEWASSLLMVPQNEQPNKYMNIRLGAFRFADIKIKEPVVPAYVAKQILMFLQPLAKFAENGSGYPVQIVGNDMKWAFESAVQNEAGDATFSFVTA